MSDVGDSALNISYWGRPIRVVMICLCTVHGMGGWSEITDHSDRRSIDVEWVVVLTSTYCGNTDMFSSMGGGLCLHMLMCE